MSIENSKATADVVRVLHVDDDLGFLDITKEILGTENNFEVDQALSVDEAFKKLAAKEYDVVVCDYDMPQKDGLQLLRELRTQKNPVPFILFTGKGREEVAIEALNLGANYYLNKHGTTETVYGELTHAIINSAKTAKAEKALRASEANYRALINGMFDTVWVIDFEGNFIDVNDAAVQVLGYSREELLSIGIQGIDKHLKKEDVTSLIERLPKVGMQIFETFHTTKDGTEIPVEISSSLVTYQGKQAILSITRNITERKKAEIKLRESEELLRLKIESVLSPDVDLDEQELSNILDIPQLQELLNDLYAITNTSSAIIDLKGKILVKTNWEDICTKFHRLCPQTLKNCLESDIELTRGIKPGEYRLYKCKNNLWDMATPLILNGKHVANVFSGQFFFEEEENSPETFIAQAKKYNFNKEKYLSAFNRVPRWNRDKLHKLIDLSFN